MTFDKTFTALVTPFQQGKIDFESFDQLLFAQHENGIEGFVINGTTGESPNLQWNEVEILFKRAKEKLGNKATYILGVGTNSTESSIEFSKKARALGADGVLAVVPYYNKPPQRGLVAHFQKIAEVAPPVILYNVPGRTITSLSTESVAELSQNQNIVAIKEASGDISAMKSMKSAAKSGFTFLSGDDGSYVEFLKAGGDGVISVATHVIPRQMVDWKKWVQAGMSEHADEDLQKYKRLIDLLFVEANPIPVKFALQKMGIIKNDELRLPLLPLLEQHQVELLSEMKKLGVLK